MKSLCGKNCDKCSLNKRCGGCSMCEMPVCKKNCDICFSLCHERPGAYNYLMSIGGANIELLGNEEIEVPEHIPVLPDRFKNTPDYNIMPIVAVHGGNMFSNNGEKINPVYLNNGYAGALNIDEKTEAILELYVKDRTLEGFWDNRHNIYKDLSKMNFKGIISPNFSVYEDAPRLDHMYNIKRTTIIYNEMVGNGLPAIPDVSWYSKEDLDEWIREINKNDIKTIAFSFQVVDVQLKAANIYRTYIPGFKYLCSNIDPDIRIMVAGLTSPRRIQEIFEATSGQKISILNQSAFIQSRRGMLSENRVQNSTFTKDELFEKNINYFNELYKKLNRKSEVISNA